MTYPITSKKGHIKLCNLELQRGKLPSLILFAPRRDRAVLSLSDIRIEPSWKNVETTMVYLQTELSEVSLVIPEGDYTGENLRRIINTQLKLNGIPARFEWFGSGAGFVSAGVEFIVRFSDPFLGFDDAKEPTTCWMNDGSKLVIGEKNVIANLTLSHGMSSCAMSSATVNGNEYKLQDLYVRLADYQSGDILRGMVKITTSEGQIIPGKIKVGALTFF